MLTDTYEESTLEELSESQRGLLTTLNEKVKVLVEDSSENAELEGTEDISPGVTLEEEAAEEEIVEGQVSESVKQELCEAFQAELQKKEETLEENINAFMDKVVDEWLVENKVELEESLKHDIAESFMHNMRQTFVDSYIDIPKADVKHLENIKEEKTQLEENITEASKSITDLSEEVVQLKRQILVIESCDGLADTQSIKLSNLAEGIDFVDEDQFSAKLETLKQFHFAKRSDDSLVEEVEEVEEVLELIQEDISHAEDPMDRYITVLDKFKASEIVTNVNVK